jgi:hypothetical protein
MAKVMHLVDPKMLEMVRIPVNPVQRTLHTLDQEMQSILNQTDLSDVEKVERYNQVLQRYLNMHTPPPVPKSKDVYNDIMNTVPTVMKRKAEALLERIQRQPNTSWNELGEFVYNGQVITGSSVVDLINDTLRHRKSFKPQGWQMFAEALHESNVPQDLVGNHERWRWMQSLQPATMQDQLTSRNGPPPPSEDRTRPNQPSPVRSRSRRPIKAPLKWET